MTIALLYPIDENQALVAVSNPGQAVLDEAYLLDDEVVVVRGLGGKLLLSRGLLGTRASHATGTTFTPFSLESVGLIEGSGDPVSAEPQSFGWNTDAGPATSGTFKVEFDGVQTAVINWDDTNAEVLAKLEGHPSIGAGNVRNISFPLTPTLDVNGYMDFELQGDLVATQLPGFATVDSTIDPVLDSYTVDLVLANPDADPGAEYRDTDTGNIWKNMESTRGAEWFIDSQRVSFLPDGVLVTTTVLPTFFSINRYDPAQLLTATFLMDGVGGLSLYSSGPLGTATVQAQNGHVSLTAGSSASDGGDVLLSAGTGAAAGQVLIVGGGGTAGNPGGPVSIRGGSGDAGDHAGAKIMAEPGSATLPGNLVLDGGLGDGTAGGSVVINGGANELSVNPATVAVNGEAVDGVGGYIQALGGVGSAGKAGGDIQITGGSGDVGNDAGGQIIVTGGNGVGDKGGVAIAGESLSINTDDGAVFIWNLPTVEPAFPNQLWNDSGTIKISN